LAPKSTHMDEPTSRIEQLLIQLAEWRVRFLHERQWRESVEKDKKALEEKYSQVVFELGTQKRAIEDLEARVALLSATTGPQAGAEEGGVPDEGADERPEARAEGAEPNREFGSENAGSSSSQVEEARQEAHTEHRHHIYSNPAVYESSVAWVHGRHHGKRRELHIEEEPYIFHRYRPDDGVGHHYPAPQKHAAAELNTVLDNEIASLENDPSEADQGA
jgi:hypothetical protein